jgi:hypothetical protein
MNAMQSVKWTTRMLGSLLVLNSPLQGSSLAYHEVNVGTAVGDNLREVNWGPRVEQTGGGWGVSSESFLGFTLTALFDGVEGSQLGYDATTSRTLGVNEIGNPGRIVYRTNTPLGREGIQLALPAEEASVGVIAGDAMPFAGIRQVAFDRLNNGSGASAGNIVTITGFVADPEASWVISPFTTPPTLTYDAELGRLSFETFNATDWAGFGLLQFDNLGATLSETGVSLVFSNDRANNNNSYGLVGWQYAVDSSTGQTYFVSPDGDDENPGTSVDLPFRTLQQAADTVQAGDLCLIRGGTYRETVTLAQSGQPGRPIEFAAFEGERVIIDGSDPVAGSWVEAGGGVWKAPVAAGEQIEAVFFDGRMLVEARWPDITWEENWNAEKKWALTGEGSDMGLVQSEALAAAGIDLSGGQVYIKLSKGNSCYSRPITSHSPGSPSFSWDATGVEDRAWGEDSLPERIATFGFVNNRFFVVASGALDAPGEWWHDVAGGELFFIPPNGENPAGHVVSIKARAAGFEGEEITDVVISGIEFRAANLEFFNSDRILVRKCSFLYSSTPRDFWDEEMFMATHRPIFIRGHDNLVEECLIRWAIESPIELVGSGNSVVNCVIQDFNLHGRHPGPGVRLRGRPSVPEASQLPNAARHNTVYNAGGVGLFAQGQWPADISHNHVFNAGIFTVDVASIYVPNGAQMQGSTVSYNWMHEVDGIGFRVDVEGRGMRFDHNLVWNTRNGAKMQGYWLEVYNNTIYVNNSNYPLMIVFEPDATEEERALWRVRNNTAYAFIDRKSLRGDYSSNPRPTIIPLATEPGAIDYNVVIPAGEEHEVFADPDNFDFRPLPGGILDKTGVTVPGVAERADSQPPSVGALEPELALLWRPGADWRPDGRPVPQTPREATDLAIILLNGTLEVPVIIKDIKVEDGGVSLTIAGPPGTDYLIQFSTDLNTWEDLELISPPAVPFFWNDTDPDAGDSRFYRVKSLDE